MIFLSVDEMRARLGLPSQEDVNFVLEAALKDSVQTLAAELRTEGFDRVDVVDTFLVRSLKFSPSVGLAGQGATSARLLMSRMFTDLSSTYTVRTATGLNNITGSSSTNLRNVNGQDYVTIDSDRGIMHINDYTLNHEYVQVTYKAGFLNDGAKVPVFIGVPEWLKTLASLDVKIALSDHPLIGRDSGRNIIEFRDNEQKRANQQRDIMLFQRARSTMASQGRMINAVATASVT